MTDPTLSVVIVNYNTRELLKRCLESLAAHAPAAQLIVVDNASRDDSVAMLEADFPGVDLVTSAENVGFAPANNLGIVRARGDFIVLLNSDTELEDDGLLRCVRWMRDHSEVGAATPRLLGTDGQWQRPSYRFPSLGQELRVSLRQKPRWPEGDRDPEAWLPGTALVLRRVALEEVGGHLDGRYFMYWEDADISARLRKAGWERAVFSEAYIRHHGGASGGGSDSSRRPDLLAWYYYGRYRWFSQHRGFLETAGLWVLDWFEVGRTLLRSAVRPSRRHEAAQARVRASSLLRAILGRTPPRPGSSRASGRSAALTRATQSEGS